jgi:hypothetical protein
MKSSSTATVRRRTCETDGLPCIHGGATTGTLRFQTIADVLASVPAKDLILDGEAVVADSRGISDFGLLQRLAATALDRYTISWVPGKRAGRIFIDYLRNGRGTTAIGASSPRARAGFPVAAPVSWRQVENGIRPDAFTMEQPPRR